MQQDGSQSPEGQTGTEIQSEAAFQPPRFISGLYPWRRTVPLRPRRTRRPWPCPGDRPGSASRPAGRHSTQPQGSTFFGHRGRHQGAAGSRGPLRPPDPSLEPEDAPLHLRRARRASTSSTCRRPSVCCTRRRSSPASWPAAAAPSCSWAPRSRPATPSREAAESCGMPYVNQRWLGGLLTNFQTISKRIKRLHELRDWTESGSMDLLPVRERIGAINERDKLETNLGGVADMQRPPDAMFVVDLKTEAIGVREAVPPEDPDHRAGRHQLRPRPGRLRDPRQRRRDPLLPRGDRGDRRRGRRALRALPRRGGGRPARARGAGAPRGRGARPARAGGAASARRPRSAPAARPRRPASRRTSPPPRAAPAPRRPPAPRRRASAARSIPTTIPSEVRS